MATDWESFLRYNQYSPAAVAYVAAQTGGATSTTSAASAPIQFGTPPTVAPPDAISIVTGIDPNEVAAATYDKIIPIWVGGMPRLGCHIIYGPTFTTSSGITYASFGVSFGMPAVNLTITRELRELRLDGYKVWSLAEGYLMTGLTFRFYPGSELQAADPLVIAAYPSAPVAHRGHCCVFIENLALTDFNLKVPFVSAVIADPEAWTVDEDGAITTETVDPEDGIGLGYALEALAYSPYINLASANAYSYGHRATADFITDGISERVDALIVAENVSFLDLINRFARLHLWDIVQRDRLMAIERGSVVPDISLDLTHIVAAGDAPPILIERSGPSDRPRELEYSFIDINRDYEINSVMAKQMSIPAPATASEGKDTIALPAVHTTNEGMSWVTLRNFKDALARETISFTTSIVGYEIEPGDIIQVDAGFKIYIIRVIESMKGANWTNRIRGEPVLRCAPPLNTSEDPHFSYVKLLLGFEGADGATSTADESLYAHTMQTFHGTAQIDTAQSRFGSSSLLCQGDFNYVTTVADSPDWDLTGPFTGECFFRYAAASSATQVIAAQWGNSEFAWIMYIIPGATVQEARFQISTDGTTIAYSCPTATGVDTNFAPNAWYHLAWDRDSSNTLRVYVGGVMTGKTTGAVGMNDATDVVSIGGTATGNLGFTGWIDEFRLTKGVSRYGDVYGDSSFAPPSVAFPR